MDAVGYGTIPPAVKVGKFYSGVVSDALLYLADKQVKACNNATRKGRRTSRG